MMRPAATLTSQRTGPGCWSKSRNSEKGIEKRRSNVEKKDIGEKYERDASFVLNDESGEGGIEIRSGLMESGDDGIEKTGSARGRIFCRNCQFF
jgi:hypothetical protein